MKKIGMLKAMKLCGDYRKMDAGEREQVRLERLREIVGYAKENSPYYKEMYRDIPEDFNLEDLPPVNKQELMKHWDEWCTERTVTLEEVNAFMENLDNIGRKLQGKYLVFTTSGSTGNPLVMLCDSTVNNVMGAVNTLRAFARKEDMKRFISKGGRTMGVFADKGFYLSNSSVRSRLLTMPWKKKQMAISSALLPTSEIVKQLNGFQPAMLGSYPSNLELLVEEQEAGRLHISPVLIMAGGEYLSDSLRERLTRVFQCYVQTSYSCTEGGSVACECRKKHFHINDDWMIVEAVDQKNRPVPDGVLSDKILLTNLYNFTQPFIRYEVTDRIILHHEPCGCGNPSPWLEIEGRNDDVITLYEGGDPVRVPPLAVYALLKEIHSIRRFQLVVGKENCMELRLICAEEVDREEAFGQAKQALEEFFKTCGVNKVTVFLSSKAPCQHPISGKFKHIIAEKSGSE